MKTLVGDDEGSNDTEGIPLLGEDDGMPLVRRAVGSYEYVG